MARPNALKEYEQCLRLYLTSESAELPAATRHRLLSEIALARGALMLSGQPVSAGADEAAVLTGLSGAGVQAALAAIQVGALRARLDRFVRASEDNGGDVSLIEDDDAREEVEEDGCDLLAERNEIECRLEGVGWMLEQRADARSAVEPQLQEIRRQLADLDRWWTEHLEHFIALNEYRRPHRKIHPEPERFWWWHRFVDCNLDAVYRAAEGQGRMAAHLRSCPVCAALLQKLSGATEFLHAAKVSWLVHPSVDDLGRWYDGETTTDEERAITEHVELCDACSWELDAMERADEVELGERLEREPDDETEEPLEEGDEPEHASAEPFGSMARDIVRTIPVPAYGGAVAYADTEESVVGVGEEIYRDANLEVRVDPEGTRMLMRVYSDDLTALGPLAIVDHDTLVAYAVVITVDTPKKREFDMGTTEELGGKRLDLSLEYRGRPLKLPRLDLPVKG